MSSQIMTERTAAEQARTLLATAEFRLKVIASIEEELRETRLERDGQRDARIEAERKVAVLSARQEEHEDRVREMRNELAIAREACVRGDVKNGELIAVLENERQARAVAERDLAVLTALQMERPRPAGSNPKRGHKQAALWQGDEKT